MPETFLDSMDIPYNGKSPEQFLALATEVVKKLGWDAYSIGEDGLSSYARSADGAKEVSIVILNYQDKTYGVVMLGEDHPGDHPYIEDFMDKYHAIENNYSTGELNLLYQDLQKEIEEAEGLESDEKTSPVTATEKLKNVLAIFIPSKDYFVTPILIYINIIIFVVMVLSGVDFMQPGNESLIAWGANFKPRTLDGEIWRLLTSCFLHIGIFHLLMNCYALLYIGVLLEPFLGRLKFIALYLLTGLVASTSSLWWHDYQISAGASGAIFGMYGVFLALLSGNFIEKDDRNRLLGSIGVFVVFNLINGMKEGIDNAAHIGGLVSGLLMGFSMIPVMKNTESAGPGRKVLALLTVLVLALVFFVYFYIPNDIGKYQKMTETWLSNEQTAISVYSSENSRENILAEIDHKGIPKWEENMRLLKEIDKLDIPDDLKRRNKKMMRYNELNLEMMILLKRAVEQDTGLYNDELERKGMEIQQLRQELNG